MNHNEHLLACLAEECMEVGHRIMKALRFGLSEIQPGQDRTNAERINDELVDLIAVAEMVWHGGIVSPLHEDGAVEAKKEKVLKYLKYAEQVGALVDAPDSPGATEDA